MGSYCEILCPIGMDEVPDLEEVGRFYFKKNYFQEFLSPMGFRVKSLFRGSGHHETNITTRHKRLFGRSSS